MIEIMKTKLPGDLQPPTTCNPGDLQPPTTCNPDEMNTDELHPDDLQPDEKQLIPLYRVSTLKLRSNRRHHNSLLTSPNIFCWPLQHGRVINREGYTRLLEGGLSKSQIIDSKTY